MPEEPSLWNVMFITATIPHSAYPLHSRLAGIVPPPTQGERETMNDLYHLTEGDLDQVSGGMDCSTAIAVAQAYTTFAGVLNALGDSAGSMYFSGRAMGVLDGGCPK